MKRFFKSDRFTDGCFHILAILIGCCFLYPLWYVVIASISDPTAVANGEVFVIPKGLTLEGYKALMDYPEILRGYANSLFYLFFGSFCCLAVTLPAGYALSRKELKGRKGLNALFIISMYFGGGLIPTYLLHSTIGWIGTIWCLIVPASLSAYNLILARSAFESLPPALHESAVLDGANEFQFFFRFAIPLCKATIAVLFLFSALAWWNEYMRFVIYMDNPDLQSLQVIIRQVTNELSELLANPEAAISGGAIAEAQKKLDLIRYSVVVVAALPFVLLYPFIQKYFNGGVMVGAVKG